MFRIILVLGLVACGATAIALVGLLFFRLLRHDVLELRP